VSNEHDLNPLVQRVDALLRRHQELAQKAEADIPLLLEAIEAAVLEHLWPELDRILERQLQELRAELAASFRQAVRRAIARTARDGEPDAS
jgi:hypothetical protein